MSSAKTKAACLLLCLFSACQPLPQFEKTVENIADDTAIKIQVFKEAIHPSTEISIQINLNNKEK